MTDGAGGAAAGIVDLGTVSTPREPAPPLFPRLADRVALDALRYVGVGRVDQVLGQQVHRVTRWGWSINYGPEMCLLPAADALMAACGYRPC
jgi:hypothetical protein